MEDDFVQFGCVKCKKTARNKQIDAYAEKTFEMVINEGFNFVQAQGKQMGIEVDDSLKTKMLKWGVKQSMVPSSAIPIQMDKFDENKRDGKK